MKIIYYYNDGSTDESEVMNSQNKIAIECGVLRGLYSIAVANPEIFKGRFCVGYKLENDNGELVDCHFYK